MAYLSMLHLILYHQERVYDGLLHPRVHREHPHVTLTTITGDGEGGGGHGSEGGKHTHTPLLEIVLEGGAVPHVLLGQLLGTCGAVLVVFLYAVVAQVDAPGVCTKKAMCLHVKKKLH